MKKRIVWAWYIGAMGYQVKSYDGLRVHHTVVPEGWKLLSYFSDHRDRRVILYRWKQYIIKELQVTH